jgi:pleiotropic regulator 1
VTGSHDSTIKMWDLRKARTMCTLTNHKKSVRAMVPHSQQWSFASASADNIKKFQMPEGKFLHNMLAHPKAIVNCMALNEDNVMVTGTDTGNVWFWDWTSGHCFQQEEALAQPGSIDSEVPPPPVWSLAPASSLAASQV